ncbi:MAG: DUF2922 family protein [Clostridium sp.]|nr:DUF2922 family protein [Clostridium sp.]
MNSVITNKLLQTESGDIVEMVEANVITKETKKVNL